MTDWTPPTLSGACLDCQHVYADRNDRLLHAAEMHGDFVRFICHYGCCAAAFTTLKEALRHRFLVHRVTSPDSRFITAYASAEPRTCRACVPPRVFNSRFEQQQHCMTGHHAGTAADDTDGDDERDDTSSSTPPFLRTDQMRLPVRLTLPAAPPVQTPFV